MSQCQAPFLLRLHKFFLAVLLLSLTSSCALMQLTELPLPADHTHAFAEQLFINGDFENAILEYEQIYETALSPEDKNQALYGLACTQMMLARTTEQFVEAISNLQKWDANKGTAPLTENRHLLVLALKQQSDLLEGKKKALAERENQQNALIANQQLKISQMTSTIEQLTTQLKKLQSQIEELEAIDENVQKNRKPQ